MVGVGVVMAVRTGSNVWRLYRAGDQLKLAEAELLQAQEEHDRLQARLSEVQSQEFIEKEALEKLGMGRSGDVILLLPQEEMSNVKYPMSNEAKPNWRKWWDLYIGD